MSKMQPHLKIPLWATVFTVCGLALLCGLGVWQVKRLQWKAALLSQMDQALAADPMDFALTSEALARLDEGQLFVRGFAEGVYRHGDEIALGPRTSEGDTGYHIITPFELRSGGILLVNRGWIPAVLKGREYARPEGGMVVKGTVRRPERINSFVPANAPDKDQWYRLAPEDIAAARHLDRVLPYILYAEESYDIPASKALSQGRPANNHQSYAIFWFTMAFVLALIYYLRFIRRRRGLLQ